MMIATCDEPRSLQEPCLNSNAAWAEHISPYAAGPLFVRAAPSMAVELMHMLPESVVEADGTMEAQYTQYISLDQDQGEDLETADTKNKLDSAGRKPHWLSEVRTQVTLWSHHLTKYVSMRQIFMGVLIMLILLFLRHSNTPGSLFRSSDGFLRGTAPGNSYVAARPPAPLSSMVRLLGANQTLQGPAEVRATTTRH
eukprot:TRINITY_DN79286_c0_g1_i1.p1 TRINITY_DN79286_c0_g1~~TRINITY_DN79286_c0_g1_i1.p1  ORF type:complete len:197 (-),score=33.09 TRINITY_DN79286_c0_g1_i1:80-670(-)